MIRNGILIFYYVDDIVFTFRKGQTAEAEGVADLLGLSYNLSGGGSLQWFSGIEVIRDVTKAYLVVTGFIYR